MSNSDADGLANLIPILSRIFQHVVRVDHRWDRADSVEQNRKSRPVGQSRDLPAQARQSDGLARGEIDIFLYI